MRTITNTFNVYTFNELTDSAKETAIEHCSEETLNFGDIEFDDVLEYWKERLENIGFIDPEIAYSGFCCQGDGASFTASIDLPKLFDSIVMAGQWDNDLKFERMVVLAETDTIEIKIERDNSCRYYHENSVDPDIIENSNSYNGVLVKNEHECLFDMVREYSRDIMQTIYRELEAEYEWQMSDECIADTLEANEYEYYEDGTQYF